MPRLNAPTILVFFLSLLLAGFAIASRMVAGVVSDLGLSFMPHQDFWLLVGAYIVLMIGNIVRGL